MLQNILVVFLGILVREFGDETICRSFKIFLLVILVSYRDLVILKMLCESHVELYIMGTIRVKILQHWLVVVYC